MFYKRKVFVFGFLFVAIAAAVFCLVVWLTKPNQPVFGVTFSTIYTQSLNLDIQQTYLAVLNDLQVRHLRIPVYWSTIEPQRGRYDWADLDFMVFEAEKHRVELILTIGRKVPRWPECFIPNWASGLTYTDAEKALFDMETAVVERYKNSSAIVSWQVENEVFFPFGVCPVSNQETFSKELSLVRSLDSRPVTITVSGELEPWFNMARQADILGISMYRISWNPIFGFFPYPLPAMIYKLRILLIAPFTSEVVVSELQAEPWFNKSINELTEWEKVEAFTVDDLNNNINFASLVGVKKVYLWGVEWWYAEKTAGHPELWEAARKIFN